MAGAQLQEETFKERSCQVSHIGLSYDAKKYLGMIHNRIGKEKDKFSCM